MIQRRRRFAASRSRRARARTDSKSSLLTSPGYTAAPAGRRVGGRELWKRFRARLPLETVPQPNLVCIPRLVACLAGLGQLLGCRRGVGRPIEGLLQVADGPRWLLTRQVGLAQGDQEVG